MSENASFSLELEMALLDRRPDRMTRVKPSYLRSLERRSKYPRGSLLLVPYVPEDIRQVTNDDVILMNTLPSNPQARYRAEKGSDVHMIDRSSSR